MKSLREQIIRSLRKMIVDCTGKSLTAIGEEESIEVADAILKAVREAMPEEMKTPKQGYSGFNSCCEYAEERSWNSYRTALLGILEEGAE